MDAKANYHALRFIENFNVATMRQLHELFYKEITARSCQRRLTRMVNNGALKRNRFYVCAEYLYYINKPTQIEHALKRVEAYIGLSHRYRVIEFVPEFSIGKIRADAYVELEINGKVHPMFLEIQRSKGFDQNKYSGLYSSWIRERREELPPVVVLTSNPIRLRRTYVKYIFLDLNKPRWETLAKELLQKEIGATPTKDTTPKSGGPSGIPRGTFIV